MKCRRPYVAIPNTLACPFKTGLILFMCVFPFNISRIISAPKEMNWKNNCYKRNDLQNMTEILGINFL